MLAVYFADRDQWVLEISPPLQRAFIGGTSNSKGLAINDLLEAAKKRFLAESRIRAADYAARSKAALPNLLQTQGQQIKVSVDAMLDSLKLFGMGYSWGGFESLIIPFDCTGYRTATKWAPGGPTLRLHIGLENLEDLKADLARGFEVLRAAA